MLKLSLFIALKFMTSLAFAYTSPINISVGPTHKGCTVKNSDDSIKLSTEFIDARSRILDEALCRSDFKMCKWILQENPSFEERVKRLKDINVWELGPILEGTEIIDQPGSVEIDKKSSLQGLQDTLLERPSLKTT